MVESQKKKLKKRNFKSGIQDDKNNISNHLTNNGSNVHKGTINEFEKHGIFG